MPLINWGDPRFQIDMLLGFLDDIDNLENSRSKEITETYEKWSAENEKVKAENEEYYDWKVDSFIDDLFVVCELKRTLLNGISVTLNTVLERHIISILRQYYEKRKTTLESRKTYTASDLKKELEKSKHQNISMISDALVKRIDIYQEIRNIIVHKEGYYGEQKQHVKQFIEMNSTLFDIDVNNKKVDILRTYIEKVSVDFNQLFKLILYTDKGKPIDIIC